ncbi:MAG: hypothetical protein IBJ12_07260 [Sphingomonadaceae bacterium]|nr:hypothetical protein [Sphingomonadaceae bacterium]
MRLLVPFLALTMAVAATSASRQEVSSAAIAGAQNPPALSAFGFFEGDVSRPSPKLIPYRLRTPLFSDYADKQRFIYVPEGGKIKSDAAGKLLFPLGTALIKSFGYPGQDGRFHVLETRVLLHRTEGWVALPYVWRADRSDADLRVGGTRIPVEFAHGGSRASISYAVPNKNQCKQCHSSGDKIMPIGPQWQNMEFDRKSDRDRILKDLPQLARLPGMAKWDDAAKSTLDERARSYLKVNCGHCHAPKGSASNSGLFLDGSARDAAAYGIGKRPVAAGRASGDLDFIIEAGRPDRSILISRMKSTDPGIAMPELGRAMVHDEGVKLLEDWISAMPHGRY